MTFRLSKYFFSEGIDITLHFVHECKAANYEFFKGKPQENTEFITFFSGRVKFFYNYKSLVNHGSIYFKCTNGNNILEVFREVLIAIK